MNLKIGIVGLPNVGKSTLFNALTKSSKAAAENFPFCTIDPNTGLVEVPDQRFDQLVTIVQPAKTVRSVVEFVDIAGLVAGASEGEGLGNQFLSHIRECHAICHVVRAFNDDNVHHVDGRVSPKDDLETIMTELILADLQSVERQTERWARKAKSGDKEAKLILALLDRVKTTLTDGQPARTVDVTEEETPYWKQIQLLTAKPYIVVGNVSEDDMSSFDAPALASTLGVETVIPICAKFEAELAGLTPTEAQEFLTDMGLERSGLERLIQTAFATLGLQSYFTAGPKEVRAWTIRQGSTAPQAAGAIHSDFERGFIKAEVIAFDDYVTCQGESKAKEQGKMRTEGKEYLVADGDVIHFRFNV